MGFTVPVLLPVPRWALTRRGFRPGRRHARTQHRTVSPLPDLPDAACAASATAACAAAPFAPKHEALPLRSASHRSTKPSSSGGGLCRLAAAKPGQPSAVCSLLHFPSPHGARPLAGILLCGARTFLHARRGAQRLPGELPATDYTRAAQLPAAGMKAGAPSFRRKLPTRGPGASPLALSQSWTRQRSVLARYQRPP